LRGHISIWQDIKRINILIGEKFDGHVTRTSVGETDNNSLKNWLTTGRELNGGKRNDGYKLIFVCSFKMII